MKNKHLEKLQEIHRDANTDTHKIMLRLFDEKPTERDAAIIEFWMSLPDLAEVPRKTPDEKIIKLIASEMSKNKEKQMTPYQWNNYRNWYLTSRKEKNGQEKVALTQTAIKHFNKTLNIKIGNYKYHTGWTVPEKYVTIHTTNAKWDIDLTWSDQIIKFIRKDFINQAYQDWDISLEEKVEFTKITCDLLIKMYAYEDEKQSHETLEESRKIFNNFTTNELTTDFHHKAKDESKQMIGDKSDRNYFGDKRYWISANTLSQRWIQNNEDIYFNIEARAKDSLSIERKWQFDPNINSANALSDIWWIRFIGKTEDELNILLAHQLMKYNEKTLKYNKNLLEKFPYWSEKKDKTNKQYSQTEINEMTKYMVRIKDKDVIKTVVIKESNDSGPEQHKLDEVFFKNHWIEDIFVLQQLRNVVEKKNKNLQIDFEEARKDKDEAKKEVLKNVIQSTHWSLSQFIENEESLEILYWATKRIEAIKTKKEQLEKINAIIEQSTTNKKIKIDKLDRTWLTYRDDGAKSSKQKTIQIPASQIDIKWNKKEAYYESHEWKFVVVVDSYIIPIQELESMSHSFIQDRKEKETLLKKKKVRGWRKIWASDRKEAKIEWDIYTENGEYFSGEHQFVTESTMKNMKPTTVAEVYDSMKAVFEEARCFNILTAKDIQTIIHDRLVPMLKNTKRTQNWLTWVELIDILSKKTGEISGSQALEEKIMNELTERGLRTLTINGVEQDGYFVKPSYVKRLKKNWLRID
jgi:hypothetical protein